ncbi:RING-H2 finger protein ATL63-like [Tripterygium wilfordii]|uniref:RING-type E3 ubiquitin transferase n=1 Tax=Tripterygium wilfordii TaxID=458696 RepID=A0A7J7BZP4_TRIWF|nr:RING-H2 finger protein ATL63-like [Tripterygium wilfordii]KAF5727318.1 RING-H2 finger protein ATL63-like [Tripterygium wilfordii]
MSELRHLINGISSYETNIMLAALISLLLVILFVLLLHIYAKWFLSQPRQGQQSSSVTVSHVLRPSRFHNFHTLHLEDTASATAPNSTSKGLDASLIASIPLFVYKSNNVKLEYCVICLSMFQEEEIGRNLPECGHGFHVECIDMWLHSHANCPICRAPALVNDDYKVETESNTEIVLVDVSSIDSVTIENVTENNDSTSSSTSSMSSLGNSLKRMLSRNSSEHRVFPTFNGSEFEA